MKIQIKHRWNVSVLFECESDSLKLAVELAVKAKVSLRFADLLSADLLSADLSFADLRSANLSSADLRSADLRSANLSSADLSSADLRSANLRSANLRSADLSSADLLSADLSFADLSSANLLSADLSSADLRSANLSSANLRSADLSSADLRSANLTPIRDDLWSVLSSAPREVQGLRDALAGGKVDGSTYTGACACLVGTLQNEADKLKDTSHFLTRNSNRPAEIFFLNIGIGQTPENSEHCKLALEWTDSWLNAVRAAFAPSFAGDLNNEREY